MKRKLIFLLSLVIGLSICFGMQNKPRTTKETGKLKKEMEKKKKDHSKTPTNFFLNATAGASDETVTPADTEDSTFVIFEIVYSDSVPGKDTKGIVKLLLYPDADLAQIRDVMAKLINAGEYNDMRFHRIIKDFMVQIGDPNSKIRNLTEEQTAYLGSSSVPVGGIEGTDFVSGQLTRKENPRFHKRYAVAVARGGDQWNPRRLGSTSQIYIVTDAQKYDSSQLYSLAFRRRNNPNGAAFYTPEPVIPQEVVDAYANIGGAPYLDEDYVVIGEVIEGKEVIDSIQNLKTNQRDYPTPGYAQIISATIKGYKPSTLLNQTTIK